MTASSPPFSALRAVEAAARHRSYTWAAKELKITHSAVSQSIKRLEADLGTVLFERAGNGMEPSEAALRLAHTYSEAADTLGKTLSEITRTSSTGAVTVVMPADFGRLWFSRRMARLTEALPDLHIETRLAGGSPQPADLEISYVAPAARGTRPVASIVGLPLCSPSFAARHDIPDPAALARTPLLAAPGMSWTTWASHYGLPPSSTSRTHGFDDAGMALDAAVQGGGIVLSHLFAAESHLEDGRLISLPYEAPSGLQLQVQNAASGAKADLSKRLEMWVTLEVSRSLALHADRTASRQLPRGA